MNKDVAFTRGFLPDQDPLETLPPVFSPWESVAKNLPKLLLAKDFRAIITSLPAFPVTALKTQAEIERAMQLLSYLGHAYIWGVKNVPQSLPALLSQPWYEVAKKLGRPPVLSYSSYALHNWKRLDPKGPIELGNIALIQNFLGGIDEEWFILVHIDIEAKAQVALQGCLDAINATKKNDQNALLSALQAVSGSIENMCQILVRMPDGCDPYIYYNRVRPYIHGWKGHPAYPVGLVYEGVAEYQEKPQQFRGETGAQSAIIPTLDGLLGITHSPDELYPYLQEMRLYMPPDHREFVKYVETTSTVRTFVKDKMSQIPALREVYNQCIELIERFRKTHLGYAASYIQKQHQMSEGNPTAVGTGGTPFMPYLKKHKDETTTFLL
jgi:indoleamine 2,3-dioxygenase